jgi:uncharacterized membrane protein YgdD (TMEM256/DUF423 family)
MSSSGKLFVVLAGILLASATGLGAYASHGLEGALAPADIATVGTAVQYQFFHGLGLLGIGLLTDRIRGAALKVAGWLMLAGALLFCGGIYAHHLLGIVRAGAVAPVGGSAMIAAWLLLAFAAARAPAHYDSGSAAV